MQQHVARAGRGRGGTHDSPPGASLWRPNLAACMRAAAGIPSLQNIFSSSPDTIKCLDQRGRSSWGTFPDCPPPFGLYGRLSTMHTLCFIIRTD